MPPILTNLKPLREARGWSQEMLALFADVSVATIFKHEQGRMGGVTGRVIERLAEALEVEPQELFLPTDSGLPENLQQEVA